MFNNKSAKQKPNFSLLFGYVFILLVIGSFAFIQFSSSFNLDRIEADLREQIIGLSVINSDQDLSTALEGYHSLLESEVFRVMESTYSDITLKSEIHDKDELRLALLQMGQVIDIHSSDLSRSQAILFIAFISLSIILSILLTISEFDQVKKLEREKMRRMTDKSLMEVLEGERNLIALELHDDVAQKLSLVSQHFYKPLGEEHSDILKRYTADIIQKIRTMTHSLRSPDFPEGDFQKQIELLVSDFSSISPVSLTTSFNGLSVLRISDDKKLHIYRIIQELLTNCRKHSSAEGVSLSMLYVHPILKISYTDDGVGMDLNKSYSGLGLRSIEYRVRILNADMKRSSAEGLQVLIRIPVEL